MTPTLAPSEQALPPASRRFIFALSMVAALALAVLLIGLRHTGYLSPAHYSYSQILGQTCLVGLLFPVFQIFVLNTLIRRDAEHCSLRSRA